MNNIDLDLPPKRTNLMFYVSQALQRYLWYSTFLYVILPTPSFKVINDITLLASCNTDINDIRLPKSCYMYIYKGRRHHHTTHI